MKNLLNKKIKGAILAIVTCILCPLQVVFAHNNPGYSHDSSVGLDYSAWMAGLPDTARLSDLSLPGTHDTMALHGGVMAECQSMSLAEQLKSGIRVLDIRARHYKNGLPIHHGPVYQEANFDDVLRDVRTFLSQESSKNETIFMRLKKEYDDEGNTRSFVKTVEAYIENGYKDIIWVPNSTPNSNPTVGEIRGKIVIFDDFPGSSAYASIQYDSFKKQDDYCFSDNWDQYNKWAGNSSEGWIGIKPFLNETNNGNKNSIYINYLSAASGTDCPGGPLNTAPYFVASGHSSWTTGAPRLSTGMTTGVWGNKYPDFPRTSCAFNPFIWDTDCTISFEGTNTLTMDYLKSNTLDRVGIIMADFPGPGLIKSVIYLNRYTQFSQHVGTALAQTDANWDFVMNSKNDLVCINRLGSNGKTDVHILSAVSNYQQFSLQVGTILGHTNSSNWDFVMNSNNDLVSIFKSGTSSGRTELHTMSAASRYTQFSQHIGTGLSQTNDNWDFVMKSNNDLVCIFKSGTGSGRTEVHTLSASNK